MGAVRKAGKSIGGPIGGLIEKVGDKPWLAAAAVAAPWAVGAMGGAGLGAGFGSTWMSGASTIGSGIMGGAKAIGGGITGLFGGGMPPATQAGRLGGTEAVTGGGGNFLGNLVGGVSDFFKGGDGEGGGPLSGIFSGASDIVGSIKSKLGDKLGDPSYMSDMLLRVGSNLAGAKLAGDGLSDDERELYDFLSERMKGLRDQNQQLFDTQMQSALEIQNQARQYDPEYWGMKAQRDVQIADAAAGRQIEQKAAMEQGSQGLSAADKRRAALDTTREAQSAYLEGREAAQDAKMKGLVAGAGLIPQSAPTSDIAAGLDMAGLYEGAETRRKAAADSMGTLITGTLGIDKPKSTGDVPTGDQGTDVGLKDPEEKKRNLSLQNG